jgi:hypothetical protein
MAYPKRFGIRVSVFVIHSSFVIRISSLMKESFPEAGWNSRMKSRSFKMVSMSKILLAGWVLFLNTTIHVTHDHPDGDIPHHHTGNATSPSETILCSSCGSEFPAGTLHSHLVIFGIELDSTIPHPNAPIGNAQTFDSGLLASQVVQSPTHFDLASLAPFEWETISSFEPNFLAISKQTNPIANQSITSLCAVALHQCVGVLRS